MNGYHPSFFGFLGPGVWICFKQLYDALENFSFCCVVSGIDPNWRTPSIPDAPSFMRATSRSTSYTVNSISIFRAASRATVSLLCSRLSIKDFISPSGRSYLVAETCMKCSLHSSGLKNSSSTQLLLSLMPILLKVLYRILISPLVSALLASLTISATILLPTLSVF